MTARSCDTGTGTDTDTDIEELGTAKCLIEGCGHCVRNRVERLYVARPVPSGQLALKVS